MKDAILQYSPSFFGGVMVPACLLLPQHFRHFDKAGKVQCLAIGGGDLLAQHTGVADSGRLVGHILQQTQLVGTAGIDVLVPAAVGIRDAAEAAVVSAGAHGNVDLLHLVIGGHVQGSCLMAEGHLPYGFAVRRGLEYVHQVRVPLAIVHKLHYLVDVARRRGHKVH